MMNNQGGVQSTPVPHMVTSSPGLWRITTPDLLQRHPSCFLLPSPHHDHLPPPLFAPSPDDHSFSQLLLGGLVGAEDKLGLRNLDNWEQFILNQAPDSGWMNNYLKQETLGSNHFSCSAEDVDFPPSKMPPWSHQVASASPPKSCLPTNKMIDFSPKSLDLNHPQQDPPSECNSTGGATGGIAKKAKIQPSPSKSSFKVKKERLGDRITALHQLVSPFGKTDTASVLLEAIGYIRFLQSQIEALSLPYLGSKSGSPGQQFPESDDGEPRKELKSRGLCLVPVSCTLDVGSNNGADYWSPAFGANFR